MQSARALDANKVSGSLELLVDHFRANKSRDRNVSLGDVAAVTEVLISTMQRYFGSIDTTIYSEFRTMSEHIAKAREEIANLRPEDIKEERIPRAGLELEAIVSATEDASGTIMDAAEEIMGADNSDADAYATTVNDACMRIFEACSFQDITGQRITKVVKTLTFIEDRLGLLQEAWGADIQDAEEPTEAAARAEPDETALLNGPALAGEGVDQSGVDSLFAATDDAPAAAVEPGEAPEAEPEPAAEAHEAAPKPAPEPEPTPIPKAVEAKPAPEPESAPKAAETEPEPEPASKVVKSTPAPEPEPVEQAAAPDVEEDDEDEDEDTNSQAEIDALFD